MKSIIILLIVIIITSCGEPKSKFTVQVEYDTIDNKIDTITYNGWDCRLNDSGCISDGFGNIKTCGVRTAKVLSKEKINE